MKRIMKNEIGQEKVIKEGFSWTTLFFGALKWFLVMLVANVIACGVAVLLIYFCI